MVDIVAQIVNIIVEFCEIQKLAEIRDNDGLATPRIISTDSGRSVFVSQGIDRTIVEVADHWLKCDAGWSAKYTRNEWRNKVRRAFGSALARLDLNVEPSENAEIAMAEIKVALLQPDSHNKAREFAFGCTFFETAGLEPFLLGPVQFESRLQWLHRKHQEGVISTVCRRRIDRNWSGKRIAKRAPSFDSSREKRIINAIGDGPFVCSVATNCLANNFALEKALVAARLATAAVALLWRTPSKTLSGLNLRFDRRLHNREYLESYSNVILGGYFKSFRPLGPCPEASEWDKICAENNEYFKIIGEVLEFIVRPSATHSRPEMMGY